MFEILVLYKKLDEIQNFIFQTLPFLLSGELFPSDVRAFCKGLTRSAASLLIVANLKLYNNLLEPKVGIGGAYYLYTAVIAASFPGNQSISVH